METPFSPAVVLLAEDDSDDRLLLKRAFRRETPDSRVLTFEHGEALIDYLVATPELQPDLILLDLNMPRMNGYETLEVLKREPEWRRIPVIIMTTSDRTADVMRSYGIGANAFVTKPPDYNEMTRAVSALCRFWLGTIKRPSAPRFA